MTTTADAPAGASNVRQNDEKNFPLKISCNLLISLDSDERIQGNPIHINEGL